MTENKRCPLQAECERKCKFAYKELSCDYYANNARTDYYIEDQEEIRRKKEREELEKELETYINTSDDEDVDSVTLKYIPTDRILPHPDNPRKELGDLSELTESIKANGILQNLTVVPYFSQVDNREMGGIYTVIIGHRRLAAAKLAGLTELPCIVRKMTPKEQIQTMLLENMQRSDLTVYEQARGFQMMLDMGSTIEEIAEKSGFSKTTVRRRVKMMELDQDTLKDVSCRQISLSDFDKLAQVEDIKIRNKLLKDIGTFNFDNNVTRAVREEYRKKVIPEAKKQIKALGLKAIAESERYSSKYEQFERIDLGKWKPEDGLSLQKTDGIFYHFDNWGSLYFYRKKKKATSKRKSKEQIEQGKAVANAHAALNEEAAVAFELRQKFVQSISVTKNTLPLLLRGAVIGIVASTVLYKSADRTALIKLYDVDPDGKWDDVRKNSVAAVIAHKGDDLTPTVVYASFQDSKINSYHGGYSGDWPKYEENYLLDALYAWLTLMGYEMSDNEKALQNGTHELFNDSKRKKEKKEEDPCTICKSAHPTCDKCCKVCDDQCNATQECRKESEG